MKSTFLANSTLSPVRRAAAFFACLGFLTLVSCGGDPDSPAAIMEDQTQVYFEMTSVLNEVAEGGDQKAAAEKLTRLGEELKELKIKLAGIEDLKEMGPAEVIDLAQFSEATLARQKAIEKVFRSVKMTPELQRALMAHHNPAPMPGEGTPD